MSKNLQNELGVNGLAAFLYPNIIVGDDWIEVMQAIGRLFGDVGAQAPLFRGDWRTDSLTYTQDTTVTDGITLAQREPIITMERDLAGDTLQVTIRAFMLDCDLRVWLYDSITKTSLGSVVLSTSDFTTPQWTDGKITITSAQGDTGLSPKGLALWCEGKAQDTEARIWTIEAFERRLEAADATLLP